MTAEQDVELSPIAAEADQPEIPDTERAKAETASKVEPDASESAAGASDSDAGATGGPAGKTAGVTEDDAVPAPVDAPARRSRLWPVLALLVAAAVLVSVGVALEIRQHSIRSQSSAKNTALADSSSTSEVIGQVSTALNKVLSYQYADPTATQQAADQLLTGDASAQYKTLFAALQQKAPGEKLTLVAKVVTAGVTSLHGNTAQLLVFLDQSSTRASDKQSSTSAAQLDVTAVKQGGAWKISELLPL